MTKLTDFIIIGAGKCGTTSLHHYLSQHPEIYMCPKKETFFFLGENSHLENKKWGAVENFEEYKSLFKDAPENAVVGEISTTYYGSPNAARLIYALIPNAKIIAILRDPSIRAYSDYLMHQNIQSKNQDFESFINPEKYFIKLGFYHSQLIRYFNIFDRKNIKILLYEDFLDNSQAFLEDLFTFLEIQPKVKIDMNKKCRENVIPKNKILYNLFIKPSKARNLTQQIIKKLPNELGSSLYQKIYQAGVYKPTLSSENRAKLIEIYRSEILSLQDLIDKDLAKWLT